MDGYGGQYGEQQAYPTGQSQPPIAVTGPAATGLQIATHEQVLQPDPFHMPTVPAAAMILDHHARKFPWWVWLGFGVVIGAGLLSGLFRALRRFAGFGGSSTTVVGS